MKTLVEQSAKSGIRVKSYLKKDDDTQVTEIRIRGTVEVATIDGYVCFWAAGREIRVGPLTPDQAERLCEDLGYDAVV